MDRTLNQRLAELKGLVEQQAPRLAKASQELIARLVALNVAAGALKTGDRLPEFALPNLRGRLRNSTEFLDDGPMVLIFYRGSWCGFCSASLMAIAAARDDIAALGGRIVAISGETIGRGLSLQAQLKDRIEFLVDADLGVSLQFGLLYRLSSTVVDTLGDHGIVPADIYGNDSGFLPIPATYVVSREGLILRHYVDANWRRRMEPAEIIAALKDCPR